MPEKVHFNEVMGSPADHLAVLDGRIKNLEDEIERAKSKNMPTDELEAQLEEVQQNRIELEEEMSTPA
jgi:hypothetical protein